MDARVKDSAETSFKLRETLEFNSIALKIKSAELLEMTKKNSDLQSDLQLVEASKLALEGEALCLRSTLGSVEAERDGALKAAEELRRSLQSQEAVFLKQLSESSSLIKMENVELSELKIAEMSQALRDSRSQYDVSQMQQERVKAKLLDSLKIQIALEGEVSGLQSTLGSVEAERDGALKAAEELKQKLAQRILDSQSQDATSQRQLEEVKVKLNEMVEKNSELQSDLQLVEASKLALEGEALCLRSTLGSVEAERDGALKAAEELRRSLQSQETIQASETDG